MSAVPKPVPKSRAASPGIRVTPAAGAKESAGASVTTAIPSPAGQRAQKLGSIRCLPCCSCCLFGVLVIIAYLGLLQCQPGKVFLLKTEATLRSQLIAVPLSSRGSAWKVVEAIDALLVQLPLFVLGYGGDRLSYYDDMHKTLGDISPFVGGVAFHKYEAVSKILKSKHQVRGQYLGARIVPDRCMVPSTLIYMSTGENHSQMRSYMKRELKGLAKKAAVELLPEPEDVTDLTLASTSVVKRSIVRNLWRRLFMEEPSRATEDNLYEYYTWGGSCVLGETFHKITFEKILDQLDIVRSRAYEDALATEVGASFYSNAQQSLGASESEAKEALQQLVDGFMFAGLLGTSHLVTHTLDRIRSAPDLYVPMWMKSKQKFLLESARVDPPVTSVTAVLSESVELPVASGFRATSQVSTRLEAGTTVQLTISTANRDPAIFGGPAHSEAVALRFNPSRPKEELEQILSWNGIHADVVKGKAPRGCIGYHAAFDIATKVIDRFLPAMGTEEAQSTARLENKKERLDLREDSDASAFSMRGSLLNTWIAYGIWLSGCTFWVFIIKFSKETSYGLTSGCYAHYLVAQCILSVGVLAKRDELVEFGMVQAAFAYYKIALIVRAHFQDPFYYSISADGLSQGAGITSGVHAPGIGQLRLLTGCVHALLLALRLLFWDDYGFYSYICYAFYTPAACAALTSILRCWLNENDAALQPALRFGVIAGIFGIANLFWPFYIAEGAYFDILSRLADLILYVPGVVVAVRAVDERFVCGVQKASVGSSTSTPLRQTGLTHRRTLRLLLLHSLSVLGFAVAVPALRELLVGAQLCFVPEDFQQFPSVCAEGVEILEKVDPHTRALYRILKVFSSPRGVPVPAGTAVAVPTAKHTLPKKDLFYGSKIPSWDEDYPDGIGHLSTLIFEFLRIEAFFPLVDVAAEWDSVEHAKRILESSSKTDLLPLKLMDWDDMTSDFAISRWAFAGIAAHQIRAVNATDSLNGRSIAFVNDWSWMHELEVRPGFERYGAATYFDEDGHLLKIWWSHGQENVTAGEPGWEHAKWAWKCSVIAGTTLRDHLVGLHFMASNFLTTAVFENLGPNHPLRRMLRPHTYGAVTINMGAVKTLAVNRGILHRASAFTWESVEAAFHAAYDMNRWAGDIKKQFRASGMMDTILSKPDLYPFGQDSVDFVNVVQQFVTDYVAVYYADDAAVVSDQELVAFWDALHVVDGSKVPQLSGKAVLTEVLANLIAYVTGFHNHAGNVADYLIDPSFASPKIRPNRNVADIQATFQGLNIGLMTALPAPKLINNFTHVLLNDDHLMETTAIFNAFQKNLLSLASKIEKRNQHRKMPSNSLNPKAMVSSISI